MLFRSGRAWRYCSLTGSAEERGGRCPLSTTPAGGICLGSLGCLRLAYGPERVMDEFGRNETVSLTLWVLSRKERKKVEAYASTFFT